MPKPLQKRRPRRRPADVNQLARHLVEVSTDTLPAPAGLSEYMAAIGRQGGLKGGKRRLVTMTAEQRQSAARKAAKARWKKKSA